MSKKVSANIKLDPELKSECREKNINISQAAELGAKILLTGIDYKDLEKLINQLSISGHEAVEANLERQNKIKLTKSLQNELGFLIKEFKELIDDWLNPTVDENFKDVVIECAIRLDLNWMNLMNLIYQSQINPDFNIKSVTYNKIKKMKITNKDIEKISTEIEELLNIDFRNRLKDNFFDISRICIPYSFEDLNCYPESYERLRKHAKMLKLPVEKVYAISERYLHKDEIQDLTREECLNF